MTAAAAFLAAALFLFFGEKARAQYSDGRHAFGIRLGNEIAADYKYSFTVHSSLDAKVGVVNPFTQRYQFFLLSAAYHLTFGSGRSRVQPYIGAGFSTGMQFGHWNEARSSKITYFLSADIPIGLELKSSSKPVVFCLEWSPKVQFLTYRRFLPQSVALGVRYIFPQYSRYR